MNQPIINHIALLIDRSGSMWRLTDGVIQQYNQQAQHITASSDRMGQKTHFSLYTFADKADQPILVEVPLDLVTLKPLTRDTYTAQGNTAMLDSIALSVDQLSRFGRGPGDSFLVIVITDGEENASVDYGMWNGGWERMSSLIQKKLGTDAWTFVFLVPEGKKESLLRKLQVSEGNVQEWEQTARGVEEYTRKVSAGIDQYFQVRQQGLRATKSFFTTNAGAIPKAQVSNTLTDVTSRFRKATIMKSDCDTANAAGDKCVVIKPFCEKYFGDFHEGSAYYSLTKKEKVQHGKPIVIEDRTTGKLYGGDDARTLLGLPLHGEIKVEPGDHGTYCIYIQSTSNNRKLAEGQTVIYYVGKGAMA